jgi:hypothetical protein
LFGRGAVRAKDDEIIRIADKPETGLCQSLVQNIENDVSQQRGDNTPLRRAFNRWVEGTLLPHSRREEFAEYLQDIAVSYPLGHQVKDQLVRNIVERSSNLMPPSRTHWKRM